MLLWTLDLKVVLLKQQKKTESSFAVLCSWPVALLPPCYSLHPILVKEIFEHQV